MTGKWRDPGAAHGQGLSVRAFLNESDHLDALDVPGLYGIPNSEIAKAVGSPEQGPQTVQVLPMGLEGVVQTAFSGTVQGPGGRVWHRHSTPTGWSKWSGAAGNRAGRADLVHLEDEPDHPGHVIKINHWATGQGRPRDGQTFGIDISNWPDARQALVIHQYSRRREAFRLDNTDVNAGIYINNTQNVKRNPGRTGAGAPFLKFHPYNMDNFADFAYLMDDLTFLNETAKTWAFQTSQGPIVSFKNAAGDVVATIDQDGFFRGQDTGWIRLPRPREAPLHGTGQARIRRVGSQVWLALHGVACTLVPAHRLLTESSFVPVGYRAPVGENPVGWVTASDGTTVIPIGVVDGGGLRRLGSASADETDAVETGAVASAEVSGTLTWITDDPMPE